MASLPIRKIVVFSGGSAANSLVNVFNEVIEKNAFSLSYIIPISDNGGSSSELMRVFGGPGIGDHCPPSQISTSKLPPLTNSPAHPGRLVRLIPLTHTPIRNLFNHRLDPSPTLASTEFFTLLTGSSLLYTSIPTAQAMLIRSILSHLHCEILKRTRPPTSVFNFQSASIGNLFLTGARLFSGSFESAIYLLAIMGGVDESKTAVLPAIISNFSHHISAGLVDGTAIVGQNAISHPSEPTALNNPTSSSDGNGDGQTGQNPLTNPHDATVEDATLPGSLPTLRQPNIAFSKSSEEPLPARIERIWYINPYGQEMRPVTNPKVLEAVKEADALIYSIGSLYTSIVPSLILRGVGDATSTGPRFKILILNGSLDRETGGFFASDFLDAVTRACLDSQIPHSSTGNLDMRQQWSKYITHLIHLEGQGAPRADREELAKWGVETVRLYGRKTGEMGMRYDERALAQALGAILGRREKGERSRRNTLEG